MEFTEEMQWDSDYLLHTGIDGPNVNLKLQEDLKRKFDETSNKIFLDTDTSTLHKVHTSSKNGFSKLPSDIDQFAVNFHIFLRYPSPSREDYT